MRKPRPLRFTVRLTLGRRRATARALVTTQREEHRQARRSQNQFSYKTCVRNASELLLAITMPVDNLNRPCDTHLVHSATLRRHGVDSPAARRMRLEPADGLISKVWHDT